jgi:hypothetical protein
MADTRLSNEARKMDVSPGTSAVYHLEIHQFGQNGHLEDTRCILAYLCFKTYSMAR